MKIEHIILSAIIMASSACAQNGTSTNSSNSTATNEQSGKKLLEDSISKQLITQRFSADPSAHVFNGKIFIYPSHDYDAGIQDNDNGDQYAMKDYYIYSFGSVNIGTDWKEYELKTTTTKSDRNRFLFSYGNYKGTVLLDNVKLTLSDGGPNLIAASDFENGIGTWVGWGNNSTRGLSADGEGNGGTQDQIIEKSTAEKKSLITAELTRFISVMVDSSKRYVKAWDVVNEPMDDNNPYQIKTGLGQLNLAPDDFFWQDYMGKDFGVEAFKIARSHGNPDDILFINDYGLETNLDKCKGLIEYAKYIESKGGKVDGIGTQMHISTLASKTKIVDMFKLLAATGKMIKVSELDLGLAPDLKQTEDATPSDYLAQAEMYKYVIDKYYEIIPVKQQYGITLWSAFDSPKGSFWKPGEPIGLWTESLIRKPAYQGVAEALKGK